MSQVANLFFNTISIIFLALTLLVGVIVLGVAMGSMESPVFAPADTLVPPTQYVPPTIPPSATPGTDLTPAAETPTPES
jgi:hypothetical protein